MNTIKGLAFFDLDGTLLDANSKITPTIRQALDALKKNGIIPVIAIGRTNTEISTISQDADIHSFITMNGQHVVHDDTVIYNHTIPAETCASLASQAQKLGHDIGFYTPTSINVSSHSPQVREAYSFIHSGLPTADPHFHKETPINMMLIIGENKDTEYHQAFPDLTFFRNTPYSTDVIAKGGSKGHGVHQYLTALNLTNIPTYGFGDGPNDLDLLKACDFRIAMGNAVPELKAIATYISSNNTDGGIIQALKHYQLI